MDTSTGMVQGRFVVPHVISSHFHLREGDVVSDFGAGSGFFVETLSHAVGQSGKVYACEIQRQLVEKIGVLVRGKGLSNVIPLWCDLEEDQGIKIADDTLDAGMLINTLFQIEDKNTALKEMLRTVRKGGKFFIVDWTESFSGIGPHPNQVIQATQAKALAEGHGLVFERDFDAGDHHYGLAFRKI